MYDALISTAPFLAVNINVETIISAVIWLAVAGLIFWLCTWMLDQVGIGEPFNKIARVLVALVAFVIVLNVLLGLVGITLINVR